MTAQDGIPVGRREGFKSPLCDSCPLRFAFSYFEVETVEGKDELRVSHFEGLLVYLKDSLPNTGPDGIY
jgi:hypothetical protein